MRANHFIDAASLRPREPRRPSRLRHAPPLRLFLFVPSPKLASQERALLATQLDTSDKLELVHALRTARRPLSRGELARACGLSPEVIRELLGNLIELAIVEAMDRGARFRVSLATRASGVEALMAIYEDDRAVVLATLTELALERIRGMAVEAFGEALGPRKRGPR